MKRRPSHAGSWYLADATKLGSQFEGWLARVMPHSSLEIRASLKGIIVPHAGYAYSGETASFGYAALRDRLDSGAPLKRIFILGPSHHFHLSNCALTNCDTYQTPLGELRIDRETVEKLSGTGEFATLTLEQDEAEHSIEMQLPFIRHVIGDASIPIVPILVGSLSSSDEQKYAKLLLPYLRDSETFFVVSSDFCHWGERFQYFHLPEGSRLAGKDTSQCIEDLDRLGMELIEAGDHQRFRSYLQQTRNTICGRYPIGVLMAGIELLWAEHRSTSVSFLRYAQSNAAQSKRDSSVSYATALFILKAP